MLLPSFNGVEYNINRIKRNKSMTIYDQIITTNDLIGRSIWMKNRQRLRIVMFYYLYYIRNLL